MYETTEQQQVMDTDSQGRMVHHMRVSYKSDDGTIHGHVTVPLTDDWAEVAAKALDERYAQHDRLAGR